MKTRSFHGLRNSPDTICQIPEMITEKQDKEKEKDYSRDVEAVNKRNVNRDQGIK